MLGVKQAGNRASKHSTAPSALAASGVVQNVGSGAKLPVWSAEQLCPPVSHMTLDKCMLSLYLSFLGYKI